MKKTLLMAGVASVFALNATALELNPYASIKLLRTDFDNQYTFSEDGYELKFDEHRNENGMSFALGNNFATEYGNIRAEFEYKNHADAKKEQTIVEEQILSNKIEAQAFMFNAYYDFQTNTKFTPYIGGGLGWAILEAHTKIDNETFAQKKDTTFAWQFGTGIAYNLNENVVFDAGYRHFDYGSIKKNFINDGYCGNKYDVEGDELYFGVRYNF